MWRLNDMLLNNQWITEDIKEEIKNYLEKNENENTVIQNQWDTAEPILRDKFLSNTILPKETRKFSNKHYT